MLLYDPRHKWLVKISRGCCLATLIELLGTPLPAKTSCRPGSLLIAYREVGRKTQLPGSPGLLFSPLVAEPTPNEILE